MPVCEVSWGGDEGGGVEENTFVSLFVCWVVYLRLVLWVEILQ